MNFPTGARENGLKNEAIRVTAEGVKRIKPVWERFGRMVVS